MDGYEASCTALCKGKEINVTNSASIKVESVQNLRINLDAKTAPFYDVK
jgi:hypothetical protein